MQHLLLLLTLALTANAATDTNYRLNTPIVPASYALTITPYFNTGKEDAFTFDGEVSIKFTTSNVTNQIKLHSEDLTYTASNITVTAGTTNILLSTADPLSFDDKYTFALINLQTNLQPDTEYTLKIVYRGPIREDLNGFYRNYYIDKDDNKKWLGATQMQPTHARKVFPCFDEPGLKARFTLTIDRPENYQLSLANTKLRSTTNLTNGYIREVFYETPIMSTYLVAFLVSEFEVGGNNFNSTKQLGVWSRPEAKNQTYYAYDFGLKVVNELSNYFGIDYYSTNEYLKLDHIALPDFRAGAMENWGLIKYREALLLYDPEESTPYYKYRVAQIIAHETTHMWFGNLVTCFWWSNAWLNEGFANYFQDYITAIVEPDVGSADILVTGSVYSAYEADDNGKAAPINNVDVNSPAEISGHFGTITYQKAGSVIRMMHHLLGDDGFQQGIQNYLDTRKFSSGYPNDMYTALEQGANKTNALEKYPEFTITEIMKSWVEQSGYPLLHVSVDYNNGNATLTLTQERFYTNLTDNSNETYKIPITYTTGLSPNFTTTKPDFVMANKTYSFDIPNLEDSWVIFNIQESGLYRVNYDDMTWTHIISALNGEDRNKIAPLNRAKIINDVFALFFADKVKFKRVNDALDSMKDETDYSVWLAAIQGLNKLRNRFIGTSIVNNIDSKIKTLLDLGINEVGYEVNASESTVQLRNRMQILEFACKVGHSGCVERMTEVFKNFKDNGSKITPSLRPVAYCQGLKSGDGDDYDFLWKRMATTNVANEARIIGDALSCTTNKDKLKEFLVSMNNTEGPIRTQDRDVPLSGVLSHFENVELVLEELEDNFDSWSSIYPSMNSPLTTIASALRTEAQFTKFEKWLSSCSNCSADTSSAARDALAVSRNVASWASDHTDDIESTLKNNVALIAPSINLLALAFIVVAFFKY